MKETQTINPWAEIKHGKKNDCRAGHEYSRVAETLHVNRPFIAGLRALSPSEKVMSSQKENCACKTCRWLGSSFCQISRQRLANSSGAMDLSARPGINWQNESMTAGFTALGTMSCLNLASKALGMNY